MFTIFEMGFHFVFQKLLIKKTFSYIFTVNVCVLFLMIHVSGEHTTFMKKGLIVFC